jgi:hypothetical protein
LRSDRFNIYHRWEHISAYSSSEDGAPI